MFSVHTPDTLFVCLSEKKNAFGDYAKTDEKVIPRR